MPRSDFTLPDITEHDRRGNSAQCISLSVIATAEQRALTTHKSHADAPEAAARNALIAETKFTHICDNLRNMKRTKLQPWSTWLH